jgi:hypothetical protein
VRCQPVKSYEALVKIIDSQKQTEALFYCSFSVSTDLADGVFYVSTYPKQAKILEVGIIKGEGIEFNQDELRGLRTIELDIFELVIGRVLESSKKPECSGAGMPDIYFVREISDDALTSLARFMAPISG